MVHVPTTPLPAGALYVKPDPLPQFPVSPPNPINDLPVATIPIAVRERGYGEVVAQAPSAPPANTGAV